MVTRTEGINSGTTKSSSEEMDQIYFAGVKTMKLLRLLKITPTLSSRCASGFLLCNVARNSYFRSIRVYHILHYISSQYHDINLDRFQLSRR